MLLTDVAKVAEAAKNKAELCNNHFGKLLGAFLFSLAIVLVVFLNGELFTGNNFVMAVGVYNKTVSVKDMVKVWVVSYV